MIEFLRFLPHPLAVMPPGAALVEYQYALRSVLLVLTVSSYVVFTYYLPISSTHRAHVVTKCTRVISKPPPPAHRS